MLCPKMLQYVVSGAPGCVKILRSFGWGKKAELKTVQAADN